jgi:hypothetical protein
LLRALRVVISRYSVNQILAAGRFKGQGRVLRSPLNVRAETVFYLHISYVVGENGKLRRSACVCVCDSRLRQLPKKFRDFFMQCNCNGCKFRALNTQVYVLNRHNIGAVSGASRNPRYPSCDTRCAVSDAY